MIIFWAVWLAALVLILIFGAVLLVGAPYLPTQKKRCRQALKLMNLKKGQTLFDLGCGDGVMLKAAAEQGLNAVGYEINPVLAVIAWARTRRYGRRVKVRYGNFWHAELDYVDGVFVFLVAHHMQRLDDFLSDKAKYRNFKVVSHAFKIPNRQYLKKSGPFFLYPYP
jgi:cyclopropane fatty-acyl-phospholipid synthase-like methyltransferase